MALKIFISYARLDQDIVKRLAVDLEALGYEIWYDLEVTGAQ